MVAGTSGARLFAIATQGSDLLTQLGGTVLIATGEGNGKGELELFELMLPFEGQLGEKVTTRRGCRGPASTPGSRGRSGVVVGQMGRSWEGHLMLFSHFDTGDQGAVVFRRQRRTLRPTP